MPSVGAHRVAYEMVVGSIPAGLDLDHLCRNRGCVNPWHLEAVPRGENLRRGRHTNKVTEDEVRAIRAAYASGDWTQKSLGQMYGLSRTAVTMIVGRKTWTDI